MTRIRSAEAADASALASLAARTFTDTFAHHNDPADMKAFLAQAYGERQQREEISDPDIVTLVVEEGDELAGFAQLRRGPAPPSINGTGTVEIWRFYVEWSFHGRGLAQALMAEVRSVARSLGARTLWLGVWDRNARAIAFYEKSGFRIVGSHRFMLGRDEQNDLLMESVQSS